MIVKFKPLDQMHLLEPVPWYGQEAFQDILFEADIGTRLKQGRLYLYLRNSINNFDVLRKKEEYISNRLKMRMENRDLTSVAIPIDCVQIIEGDKNKAYSFLLEEKEELL